MTCLPERNLVKSPTSAEKAAASAKAQPLIDWRAATSAAIGLASTAALYSGEQVRPGLRRGLDLVPQGGERPNPAIVLRPDLVEPPQEVVGPVLPRVAGGRGAAVDEPPLCEEGEQPLLGGRRARGRPS